MLKTNKISLLIHVLSLNTYTFLVCWVTTYLVLNLSIAHFLVGHILIILFGFSVRKFTGNEVIANLGVVLFSISPWLAYSVAYSSMYLFLLLILLVIFISFLYKKRYWSLFFIGMLIVFLYKTDVLNLRNNDAGLFTDPGIINGVNSFRGDSVNKGYGILSKISENRYLFMGEYLVIKYLKHFTFSTIFSPQEKMFGFSFSPPVLLGLLIPFVYGIWKMEKRQKFVLFTLYSMIVLPSFLSKMPVDLDKMQLTIPLIIICIAHGIYFLYIRIDKFSKIFLFLSLLLTVFQFFFVVYDVKYKEYDRYSRYFPSQQNEK